MKGLDQHYAAMESRYQREMADSDAQIYAEESLYCHAEKLSKDDPHEMAQFIVDVFGAEFVLDKFNRWLSDTRDDKCAIADRLGVSYGPRRS